MTPDPTAPPLPGWDDFDLSFKVFYELMARKVSDILLVSSPYDAFIMEEEGRLAERIIHEYRGLNLSRPPKLTWVSTAHEALEALGAKKFDLVITMPSIDDMAPYDLGRTIKRSFPSLPVFLLAHGTGRLLTEPACPARGGIDKLLVWMGNADLLLAMVKSVEDRMNIDYDTHRARVRVIIMVEDSPIYYATLVPMIYKEIVLQTQAAMEESLNDEHRIFRMRARPKVLVAETYEEALALYRRYKPYLLSVLSDVRFPKGGRIEETAGFDLLSLIRRETPDLPTLMFSREPANRALAEKVHAVFLNKGSPTLHAEIRCFFKSRLGFGDFIFRMPDGTEVGRAANLLELERVLPLVPSESVYFHAQKNDFSSWLMARSEILLATKLKPVKATDFADANDIKHYLVECIRLRRRGRQRGVITQFFSGVFDPDADFVRIGKGSLGGKARGLAFMATELQKSKALHEKFPGVQIAVPRTLVVSTEGFDAFIEENRLHAVARTGWEDARILDTFARAPMPGWLHRDLEAFCAHADYPLAVRSSSLLEDAQFQPFAGIYRTYMLPNSHPDPDIRLQRLETAVKLVYASTYLEAPRSYARNTRHRIEDEKMAVIIQRISGSSYAGGRYHFPAVSGVAESYNFYPLAFLLPEEGIAHIALGLGKTVVEGGASLRFCPRHARFLPQFSTVADILRNAQRIFYALRMEEGEIDLVAGGRREGEEATLVRLEVGEAAGQPGLGALFSTYDPQDDRIRDVLSPRGVPLLTWAGILKRGIVPLPEILNEVLALSRKGMGGPVEIEFAVDIPGRPDAVAGFDLLQIRPMARGLHVVDVDLYPADIGDAFCFSSKSLGNGVGTDIADIVFVKPESFDPARTVAVAGEIGRLNRELEAAGRKYVLIGPGRWGSSDRWLGIPVTWSDISGVGAIVETSFKNLSADPSQGSHFFHNITSLGISYLTVTGNDADFLDWQWLGSLPAVSETAFLRHCRLDGPMTIKVDGKTSRGAMIAGRPAAGGPAC